MTKQEFINKWFQLRIHLPDGVAIQDAEKFKSDLDSVIQEEIERRMNCPKCGLKLRCGWCDPFNQPIPPEGIVL